MSKMIELNENKLELKKMINDTIYDYLEYILNLAKQKKDKEDAIDK